MATKSTSAKAKADRQQAKPGRVGAEGAAAGQAKRVKVTQIRSGIGFDKKQSLALRGLGLRRLNHTVDVVDTPSTRGLILKVRHLVTVNE